MALGHTMYTFAVTLSDVDRGVYESWSQNVARHPSESMGYLVTRVIAYSLEYEDGIVFTTGLSTTDEPPVWVRDLTGALRVWIDVGTPSVERIHKASKAADRVAIYCHKDTDAWFRSVQGERVHAPERISVTAIDPAFIDALGARIDRRTELTLTLTEGTLFAEIGGEQLTTPIVRMPWPG